MAPSTQSRGIFLDKLNVVGFYSVTQPVSTEVM